MASSHRCGQWGRALRMLLATLGSRGDVEPFVWLARAAQDAGHQVRVALPVSGDVDTRGGGRGVHRPGSDGGSHHTEGWESWQHRGSIRRN